MEVQTPSISGSRWKPGFSGGCQGPALTATIPAALRAPWALSNLPLGAAFPRVVHHFAGVPVPSWGCGFSLEQLE